MMRTNHSVKPIELQDATRLQFVQKVVETPEIQAIQERLRLRRRNYPQTDETVGRAYRAGREEAKQAALATGVDFMGRYESMCKALWDTLDIAAEGE
jgi:hypothetical protein